MVLFNLVAAGSNMPEMGGSITPEGDIPTAGLNAVIVAVELAMESSPPFGRVSMEPSSTCSAVSTCRQRR
jgi:hypothetical protein